MATKKLTIEIDADVSKAKRKVSEIAPSGGAPGAGAAGDVAPSAERTARALDKAAAGAERLGGAAQTSAGNMAALVRGFAGMGIGMAMKWAANRYEEEGALGKTLRYGGSLISGAAEGAMLGGRAGPKGAVVGAVVGGAKGLAGEYMDDEGDEKRKAKAEREQREENMRSIEAWERARARTQKFREELENLTRAQSGTEEAIAKREDEDRRLGAAMRDAANDTKALADLQRDRQANAGELDALRAALKGGRKSSWSLNTDGGDALARIGGSFGGGSPVAEMGREMKGIHTTLRSIERKTGGATWQ